MKYLLTFFTFVAIVVPTVTFAAEFVPLTNIEGLTDAANSNEGLTTFLNLAYRLCIGLAASLAVLQIMRAGFLYMGGDSIGEKKEAKNLIALSLFGLLLVLSPVIVFGIIDPRILSLQLNTDGLQIPGAQPIDSNEFLSITQQCDPDYVDIAPGSAHAQELDRLGRGDESRGEFCCSNLLKGSVRTLPPELLPAGFSADSRWCTYDRYPNKYALRVVTDVERMQDGVATNARMRIFTKGFTNPSVITYDTYTNVLAYGLDGETCSNIVSDPDRLLQYIRSNYADLNITDIGFTGVSSAQISKTEVEGWIQIKKIEKDFSFGGLDNKETRCVPLISENFTT